MSTRNSRPATKDEVEQELLNLRAEQDQPLHRARDRFFQLARAEIDWWYGQARQIALAGRPNDQQRYLMIKCVLDKIVPDRREITRGAAHTAGALIQINNVNRGTDQAVEALAVGEPVEVVHEPREH